MKKVILAGLALIFASCDQSIESRLEQGAEGNTQSSQATTDQTNVKQEYVSQEKKTENSQDSSSENKPSSNDNKEKQAVEKTDANTNKTISSEPEKEKTNSIAPQEKKENVVDKNNTATKATAKKESNEAAVKNTSVEAPKNAKTLKKEQAVSEPTATEVVDNKKNTKDNNKAKKQTAEKQAVEKQKNNAKNKNSRNKKQDESDGTYENGKLISTLTEEEQRVGLQRQLTKDEIQYYKSLCRYAYMSEQDVIDNRCEAKKVSVSR